MELGKRVKRLRLEKDLTQHELAEKVFVSRGLISQIEAGVKTPAVGVLAVIAEVLGTTTDYLIRGDA